MTLVEMIRKRKNLRTATATVATTATPVTETGTPSCSIANNTTVEVRPTQGSDGDESLPATPCPDVLLENAPATLGLFPIPDGFCPDCGGGFWIRETWESPYICGRCLPAPHVESVYVPGGSPPLTPPIETGWLVVYRDRTGKLCGGSDDRAHGTVADCKREEGQWVVALTNGQQLPLSSIRGVASTCPDGSIRAAWTVREHGYDGNGSPKPGGVFQ